VGPDGTLFVQGATALGVGSGVDVTPITAERAAGRPVAYQLMDGTERVELLGARSPAGHALVYWWKPSRDWQAIDLTEITGHKIVSLPEAWVAGARAPRRRGGPTATARLLQLRSAPHAHLIRWVTPTCRSSACGTRSRKVLRSCGTRTTRTRTAIPPRPDEAAMESVMFGATNSVSDYFRENSGGTFTLQNAGVLGWYEADHPLET
jgi:hypothetical protein